MSAAGHRARTGAVGVRRRWRLTRRGRFVAVVVMTAAVLLLLFGPALLDPATAAAEAVGGPQPIVVVAARGDTVWDLALAHLPAGREPTLYVAEVLAVNDLPHDVLRPGDVLALPQD